MSTSITTFSSEYSVAFNTKKGVSSLSIEGAIHKGGAALAALKDVAVDSAISKAMAGRYTAAVDILSVAFPRVAAAAYDLVGSPSMNKANFTTFVKGVLNAKEPAKGFSKKQIAATQMANALASALKLNETASVDAANTIEMA